MQKNLACACVCEIFFVILPQIWKNRKDDQQNISAHARRADPICVL